MKRTPTILLAAAVLLLVGMVATASFATIGPANDSFGVYFNSTATRTCRGSPIATTPVTAYLMLINPTTQVAGFEIAYKITGWMEGQVEDPDTGDMLDQGFVRTQQTIVNSGLVVDLGNSTLGNVGSFAIRYGTPRPAVPIMTMVTWKFMNMGFMGPDPGLHFYLTGLKTLASPGAGGWPMIDGGAPDNSMRRATVSSGSLTLPVAETNTNLTGGCQVADENSGFGSVKSLFR
jgi:hypothetical protein